MKTSYLKSKNKVPLPPNKHYMLGNYVEVDWDEALIELNVEKNEIAKLNEMFDKLKKPSP